MTNSLRRPRKTQYMLAAALMALMALGGAQGAYALSMYFSGHLGYGTMALSNQQTVSGGRTEVFSTGPFSAYNATYVYGYITNWSTGTGMTELTHAPRVNAKNGAGWTWSTFQTGTFRVDGHVK